MSKLEIIWRKDLSALPGEPGFVYRNYISDDHRFKIIHNKNTSSKLWELFDAQSTQPADMFRTLSHAKTRAYAIQRLG